MRRIAWTTLREQDQAIYQTATAFLTGRLEEGATIDWALALKPKDVAKRLALLDLLHSPAQTLTEPWQSAWRLIEETWNNPEVERHSMRVYEIQRKLRKGDISGALIAEIVQMVAPQLKIEPFPSSFVYFRRRPKKPNTVDDILKTSITSGEMIAPDMLDLKNIKDKNFLKFLANSLDAAVLKGLDIARRTGWTADGSLWQLGELYRVYYVLPIGKIGQEEDPDKFHDGLAPSVKLLHFVVLRLVDLDISLAMEFIRRWKTTNSPIHVRLWAAMARDTRLVSADEIGKFLLSLDNRQFWDVNKYPEIAELRAIRFRDLTAGEQVAITQRIRKAPPRNHWPKNVDAGNLKRDRLYWALRELRRIEVAGAPLPDNDKKWLNDRTGEFPKLKLMERVDEGFLTGTTVFSVGSLPDTKYDQFSGEERLKALEAALSSAKRSWEDDPASRAWDWIRTSGNASRVLSDFEALPDGGAAFPLLWESFGRAHALSPGDENDLDENKHPGDQTRVINLLAKLPESAIKKAIRGLSQWLYRWRKMLLELPQGPDVWFRLWPEAVAVTNEQKEEDREEIIMSTSEDSSREGQTRRLDVLNTPTGELIGVFLASCPSFSDSDVSPFGRNSTLKKMRDTVIISSGRSGIIVRHRLIEGLEYFLSADPDWTKEHLIKPLSEETSEARILWRAISMRTHFSRVLKIIGAEMAERAIDRRLGREIRRSLVFSLMLESLYALREKRLPAVPYERIQQMLRLIEDEIRAFAAESVQRFLRDLSDERGEKGPVPAQLFQAAVVPFFQQVWPQERSLTTPGISHALAPLPAASGEAFAEAVHVIEPFLVPCECWSMLDYGLYGEESGQQKVSFIDNDKKVRAFLQLLNLTIGTSERAIIPHDLSSALDQIETVSPDFTHDQVFRRLATAARRI